MKKIPTLFKRTYDGPRIKGITDEVAPGLEWVLAGEGLATVKIDGTCCAVSWLRSVSVFAMRQLYHFRQGLRAYPEAVVSSM